MAFSKLPRRLAIFGIVVGFLFMAAWLYVSRYDPFHLPTLEQARGMGNFSEPLPLEIFEDATFALCPGSFLHIFTMDAGSAMTCLTWTAAALLNGPIYYGIGLAVARLLKGRRTTARSA